MGSNKLKQHDEPCLLYSGKIDTEQPYVLSIWKTSQILFFYDYLLMMPLHSNASGLKAHMSEAN